MSMMKNPPKEIREKMSLATKNAHKAGKFLHRKGKTLEEFYGSERAASIREKLSKARVGLTFQKGVRISRDELIDCYVNKKMTSPEIASLYGVDKFKVLFWLRRYGIDRRTQSESMRIKFSRVKHPSNKKIPILCAYCKKEFFVCASIVKKRRHCSKSCQYAEGPSLDARKKMREVRLGRHFPKLSEARRRLVLPRKDTSIEIALQNALRDSGIIFTKHRPILGQPDIFIEPNVCIFVDGDYWHACPFCFDRNKLGSIQRGQIVKDTIITQALINDGYIVLRFWGHEIKSDVQSIVQRVVSQLNKVEVV